MLQYSFPIILKENSLILKDLIIESTSQRKLSQLKEVLFDNSNLDFDCTLYKMYRGVYYEKDKDIFKDLRHDLTLITTGAINQEFIKTYGHYHPKIKDKSYAEIYQIICGKALFLLQDGPKKINKVIFVFSQENDIVIIPPNMGHITINIAQENLILANLVSRNFESLYEPMKKRKGGTYYVLENNPLKWIANSEYAKIPAPQIVQPKNIFKPDSYIYNLARKPKLVHFLAEPHQFPYKLEDIFSEKSFAEIKSDLKI